MRGKFREKKKKAALPSNITKRRGRVTALPSSLRSAFEGAQTSTRNTRYESAPNGLCRKEEVYVQQKRERGRIENNVCLDLGRTDCIRTLKREETENLSTQQKKCPPHFFGLPVPANSNAMHSETPDYAKTKAGRVKSES